ncbi:MAG: AMP-binding protein [Candidatus Lokiarchaeota archaeon]|nr:AMP-binding protein [Candidatus Lokiarchaeota archaeon]
MKDYSDWEAIPDYDNDSPYLESKDRPWLKIRPSYIPKTIKFDPIPVHELIKLSASKYPNNVCVYYKPADKKYTYRELVYSADRIANALYETGVKKGDAVAIMTDNCPEFLFCCLGIMETGAAVVPINPLLKEKDVIHIIRDAGNINTLFVHKNNYRTIKKVRNEIELRNVILLRSEVAKPDTTTLEEFIKGKEPKQPDIDFDPINDIAALLYTGGTTGLPKGVMLTHNNLVSDTLGVLNNLRESEEEDESLYGTQVSLTVLPICHSFGFQILIITSVVAYMLIMFESFNPSEVLEAIEYYKCNTFIGVPVMFQMLVNSPDFTSRDLSSLESATSGSATLATEINKKWEAVVGFRVGQGFGLTETSPVSHHQPGWLPEIKPDSIGVPLIDTDCKIIDPDTLEEVAIGKVGELLIKGPQVMKGYWKKPEETAATFVGDWLRTGDLARMDEKGYFFIEGRTKDIIKYKGYKVMPKEVEEKLYEHPAVLETGVVSAPDPSIGETIKAYIALKPEYKGKVTEQDIIEWAKENMASYKYPRQIEFVTVLPRTPIGKIFRRILRERAMNHK